MSPAFGGFQLPDSGLAHSVQAFRGLRQATEPEPVTAPQPGLQDSPASFTSGTPLYSGLSSTGEAFPSEIKVPNPTSASGCDMLRSVALLDWLLLFRVVQLILLQVSRLKVIFKDPGGMAIGMSVVVAMGLIRIDSAGKNPSMPLPGIYIVRKGHMLITLRPADRSCYMACCC